MSADPDVARKAVSEGWKKVPLPDDAPANSFLADPPTDLTAPSSGGFTLRAKSPHGEEPDAKSPHGITRTGAILLDERPPSTGRPVAEHHRRPVVAVLDTAISAHPWLGNGVGPGSSWELPNPGDTADPWPAPELPTAAPTDPDTALAAERVRGHGTFIAGIVRQIAPEARILSLPVMSSNGRAETSDVLATLGWLLRRVRHARSAPEPHAVRRRRQPVVRLVSGSREPRLPRRCVPGSPRPSRRRGCARRRLGREPVDGCAGLPGGVRG